VTIPLGSAKAFLTLWQVEYAGADAEWYAAPLTFAEGGEAERLRHDEPQRVVAEVAVTGSGQRGVLYDALGLREFDMALLDIIARRRRLKAGAATSWPGADRCCAHCPGRRPWAWKARR